MHITYMIRKKFNIVWFDRKKVEFFFLNIKNILKIFFLRVSLSVSAPEIWNLSVGRTRIVFVYTTIFVFSSKNGKNAEQCSSNLSNAEQYWAKLKKNGLQFHIKKMMKFMSELLFSHSIRLSIYNLNWIKSQTCVRRNFSLEINQFESFRCFEKIP